MKQNILYSVGAAIVVAIIGFLFWFWLWVSNVDNHELGFRFDRVSGKVEVIEKKGWVILTPYRYSLHTIDLRPYQINLSANQRVLNAKLVQFNPEGLQTFVSWHGRDAGDETSNMLEILKVYAFASDKGESCPFLTVLQEIKIEQGGNIVKTDVKKSEKESK